MGFFFFFLKNGGLASFAFGLGHEAAGTSAGAPGSEDLESGLGGEAAVPQLLECCPGSRPVRWAGRPWSHENVLMLPWGLQKCVYFVCFSKKFVVS